MENKGVENQANTNTTINAQEKTSSLAAPTEKKPSKLSGILETLEKYPLFMGKRKFVVIPMMFLALALIIVLAVILISGLSPEHQSGPSDSEFFSEIVSIRDSQWHIDVYNDMQKLVKQGKIDEALNAMDELISAETNDAKKSILVLEKSYIAANDDRFDTAKETVNNLIELYKTHNENLENSYGYLASLYELSGDIEGAIRYYQLAVDNPSPTSNESGFFQAKIIELRRINDANAD